MKVEKLKETEEELTMQAQDDLFYKIVRGEDVTETIETTRGKFTIKYPRIRDLETIGRLTAMRQNELPQASFEATIYSIMQKVATLDVLTISGPAWFENAKKENTKGTVWQNIPLVAFVDEVYSKTLAFRDKVQGLLEEGGKRTNNDVAIAKDATMGGATKQL